MAISARNVPIPLTSPPEWVNNGDGTYTVTYIVRSGAQLLSIPFTPESMINGNGVPGNGLDNIFAELTTATASNMGLAILGQGQAGMFDSNFGGFVGSYVAINATEDRPIEGFWIIAPEDLDQHTFSVTGTLIDNNTAQLTSGTQKLMLTGLPIAIPSELDDLSTETFCNHNDMGELLVGITGEGASAMNQGGCGLVGSLLNFKPGQGYWLTANDPFTFNFTYLSDCDLSTDWSCIGPCQFCDLVTNNYYGGAWDLATSEQMCNDAPSSCGGCIWTQACDCDGGVLDGCGICGSGICDDVDEDGICDCNDGCVSEGYDNLDPVTGLDCAGECNGTAELDCADVCNGGNVCDGECFGCCEQGICVSNIWNGLGGGPELDCSFFTGSSSCGAGGMSCEWVSVCDCDNNVFDCLGICNGDALLDWCGVCNGDGTSCCDSGVFDECGVCDGPGPEYCHACPHPDFDTGPCICDIDADGICDDLDDCVWNGECEECTYYGNGVLAPSPSYPTSGHDCDGVCNGPGVMQTGSPPYDGCCPSGILDECGVCDGSGKEMCGCADLDGNDVGVCLPIT
jgi:hypothetical protein